MLRKYEEIKNNVEALMVEEDEEVSLPETKEAVRIIKIKKKHHGMEL